MDNETISITAYGQVDTSNYKWLEWYEDFKKIIKSIGYEYNYVGISSKKLNSGKIMTVKRSESKVINELQNAEEIKSISLFSLPKDYKSASFDYDVMIVRNVKFITIIMNKSDYLKINEEEILLLFRKYLNNISVEVYEMDRYESPLIYANKVNPESSFESLKKLKNVTMDV